MGHMLRKVRNGSASLQRQANSSSVARQVSPIWWRDCLRKHREKSYFEVGSGSELETG